MLPFLLSAAGPDQLPWPCPEPASWQLLAQVTLPREGPDSQPIGGFSAAVTEFQPGPGAETVLWLLSDAPQPFLLPVRGVDKLGAAPLRIGRRLPLTTAAGEPFP
ncbi:MAG: hypothetical protein WBM08_04230, partial [Prochlorococcaceae cyanobacterium]